ncbi:MAG: RES family NAD+ phosphorylase [Alphaproteobacteria bacterium]|jgi:hypothetical protein|nr:RES family NAD+ phosphorylase [Alphaproteobacteria bacterium]MBT5390024.1 RES family NAD+ phosphorylase [Alphaproteobacteria bacterium]MBT5654209.1 RES family NAD+ phosphorylase [Alphaproteobacteria bacterium]
MKIPKSAIRWLPCWRIIPSRYPPVNPFERIAGPQNHRALAEIESMTNDRLRSGAPAWKDAAGTKPASNYISAAFTHKNRRGSRFSDGSWGVYYAAFDLQTAIAETTYHRENFLRATGEGAMFIDMRVLVADLVGDFHDLRTLNEDVSDVYHPTNYGNSQALALRLKSEDSNGLTYKSVRQPDGLCTATFKAAVLSNCRQERHLSYHWNGEKIVHVFEKRALRKVS